MSRVTSLTNMPDAAAEPLDQADRAALRRRPRRVRRVLRRRPLPGAGRQRSSTGRSPPSRRPSATTRPTSSPAASSPTPTSRRRATTRRSPCTRRSSTPARRQRPAYLGPRPSARVQGRPARCAAADYQKVVELSIGGEMANVDAGARTLPTTASGRSRCKQDKPQEAVDQLLKALAIKRTDADTMNLLGAAYVKAGEPDKAIEPLEQAILFVPVGWAEPYQALADAYTAKGETEHGRVGRRDGRRRRPATPRVPPRASRPSRTARPASTPASALGLLAETRPATPPPPPTGTAGRSSSTRRTSAAQLGLSRVDRRHAGPPLDRAGAERRREQLMTASPAVTDTQADPRSGSPSPPTASPRSRPRGAAASWSCSCCSSCCSPPCSACAIWYLLFRQPIPLPTIPGEAVMPGYATSIYGAQRPMGVAVNAAGDRIYIGETAGDNTARVFDGQGNELARMVPPAVHRRRPRARVPRAQPGHGRGLRLRPAHGVDLRLRRGRHVPARVRRRRPGSPAGSRWACAFDAAGNLYVTDVGGVAQRDPRVRRHGRAGPDVRRERGHELPQRRRHRRRRQRLRHRQQQRAAAGLRPRRHARRPGRPRRRARATSASRAA